MEKLGIQLQGSSRPAGYRTKKTRAKEDAFLPVEAAAKECDSRLGHQPRQPVVDGVRKDGQHGEVERGARVQEHRVVHPIGYHVAVLVEDERDERRIARHGGGIIVHGRRRADRRE